MELGIGYIEELKPPPQQVVCEKAQECGQANCARAKPHGRRVPGCDGDPCNERRVGRVRCIPVTAETEKADWFVVNLSERQMRVMTSGMTMGRAVEVLKECNLGMEGRSRLFRWGVGLQ